MCAVSVFPYLDADSLYKLLTVYLVVLQIHRLFKTDVYYAAYLLKKKKTEQEHATHLHICRQLITVGHKKMLGE